MILPFKFIYEKYFHLHTLYVLVHTRQLHQHYWSPWYGDWPKSSMFVWDRMVSCIRWCFSLFPHCFKLLQSIMLISENHRIQQCSPKHIKQIRWRAELCSHSKLETSLAKKNSHLASGMIISGSLRFGLQSMLIIDDIFFFNSIPLSYRKLFLRKV